MTCSEAQVSAASRSDGQGHDHKGGAPCSLLVHPVGPRRSTDALCQRTGLVTYDPTACHGPTAWRSPGLWVTTVVTPMGPSLRT
jgi:hypothetical protein